jgi:hypothetical protein
MRGAARPDRVVAAHLAGAQEPVLVLQLVEDAYLAGDEVSQEKKLDVSGVNEPPTVEKPVAGDRPVALPAGRVQVVVPL